MLKAGTEKMSGKITCRILTGPTASGKTALSLRLAEKHGWEICCMDSMQVYRGMDIGTAKPDAEDRKRVVHHLLDICDPKENFSVAMYREMAEELIRKKWQEGKELLFVGGTTLYLLALTQSMDLGSVPANEKLRAELHDLEKAPEGRIRLWEMLRDLDPETAQRLPVNDVRRIIRAIEVSRATGIPYSRQPQDRPASCFIWKTAALHLPRDILYAKINQRVLQMMKDGLAEEVAGLLGQGVPPDAQSMQALGYKETVLYLKQVQSLEKTIDDIQKGTRHYAKRQETFLRAHPEIPGVEALRDNTEQILEGILA